MADRCLTVVMPCFNEIATLERAVERVLASPYVSQLVIVDDGSEDGSQRRAGRPGRHRRAHRPPPAPPQPGQGGRAAHRFRRRHRRVRDRERRRPRVRPRRLRPVARTPPRRPGRRRLRQPVRHAAGPPGAAVLALPRQCRPHDPVEHADQPQPHRHGDVLQGVPPRRPGPDHHRGGPLRGRARADGQGVPPRVPHLRGRHLLRRSHLRRGQEDRLEGRRARAVVHPQVLEQARPAPR